MPPHPLTHFEIKNYYRTKSRFNGISSRKKLYKNTKDRAYVISLDEVRRFW